VKDAGGETGVTAGVVATMCSIEQILRYVVKVGASAAEKIVEKEILP
jgi:hypothetical protein